MAKLIVRDEDATYLLDLGAEESVVLGRAETCDLPVRAPRASRRHCEIAPGPGGTGHQVRDLGSTNGTRVNGAPVADAVALGDGDVVDAGGCVIVYRSAP